MKNDNYILISIVLTLSILLVAVTSLTMPVYAQEDGNATDSDMPKFFAIQHATSGSISEINETTYSLELNDVSDKTILFADRPDRIVTSVSTSNFIGNWSMGANGFSIDPPNAVLVIDEVKSQQDTAIVELFNPIYNSNKKTLKYDTTLDNVKSLDLPNEVFGGSTLVIDSSSNNCIAVNS